MSRPALIVQDTVLRTLTPHREPPTDRTLSETDRNQRFRVNLLLIWLGTNA